MTKRDKIILFSASLLTVCLIVSFIVLYTQTSKVGNVDPAACIITCSAVLAGIFSVQFVYRVKVRRRAYEKLLNDDYYKKYEIVRDAVINSQLSNGTKREIKNEIIDLLLSAQKSGKTADSVVSDPVTFSKEIIRSYLKPASFAVFSLLDAVTAFTAFILGTNILLWLEQTGSSFFSIGISVNMIVFYSFIALLAIPATKWFVRTGRNWAFIIPISCGILFVLLSEILRRYYYGTGWVRVFLDGTLVMIPSAAVLAVCLVIIPLLIGIKAWLRKTLLAAK